MDVAQAVAGDGRDLGDGASGEVEPQDRRAAKIVEGDADDAGTATGFAPARSEAVGAPVLAGDVAQDLVILGRGWRSVFIAISVIALAGLALTATALPETRPPHERAEASLKRVLLSFGVLLTNARFMGLTCTGGFGMAGFFVFLAQSSFVYIKHFGLSPTQYSLAFSINAVGLIGSSQCAFWLGFRFGIAQIIKIAAFAFATLASVLLCSVTMLHVDSLAIMMVLLFSVFACLGLILPTTAVLSLEDHGSIAGLASALGGTIQMIMGAFIIAVAGFVFDGSARSMVALITLCALGALITASLTLRGKDNVTVGRIETIVPPA